MKLPSHMTIYIQIKIRITLGELLLEDVGSFKMVFLGEYTIS